jgi:hypothetical protein
LTNPEKAMTTRETIDDAWKANLLRRLRLALERNARRLQRISPKANPRRVTQRQREARALSDLTLALERLLELDRLNFVRREDAEIEQPDDAKAALIRRLDARLAATRANDARIQEDETKQMKAKP